MIDNYQLIQVLEVAASGKAAPPLLLMWVNYSDYNGDDLYDRGSSKQIANYVRGYLAGNPHVEIVEDPYTLQPNDRDMLVMSIIKNDKTHIIVTDDLLRTKRALNSTQVGNRTMQIHVGRDSLPKDAE